MSRRIERFHQNILAQYRRLSENSSRQYSVSVLFIYPTIKAALWDVRDVQRAKRNPGKLWSLSGLFCYNHLKRGFFCRLQ